mmetsp:Transcript_150770/g.482505  ORF Transcript_150770/g.482505 Transcript_150770/m.482505 type:complete len:256 (-) Transcript_150770:635-1402(-)
MSCFTFANGSSAILLARAVKSVLLSFTPFMRNKDSMAFLPASLAPRAAATTGATATRVRWRRAVASKEVFGSSACSTSASIADMALLSAATAFARRKLTPAWANRMVAPEVFSLTMVFTMVTACVSACSSSARILVRESYVVAFEAHMPESLVAYSLSSMRIAATVDRRWLALEMLVTAAILFFFGGVEGGLRGHDASALVLHERVVLLCRIHIVLVRLVPLRAELGLQVFQHRDDAVRLELPLLHVRLWGLLQE